MLKNALSAKAVASLKSGKHRDGEGLQFEVKGGSRRWTFSYMWEGRQRELAIGKYPAMSLADARAKRAELREAKDRGLDPRSALAGTTVPAKAVTFRQDMEHLRRPHARPVDCRASEGVAAVDGADCGSVDGQADARLTQADVLSVIKPSGKPPTRPHDGSLGGSSRRSSMRWPWILRDSAAPIPAATSCGSCLAFRLS